MVVRCNCYSLRRAARRATQLYDQLLAPCGLKATQYMVLEEVARLQPISLGALASQMIMERATIGKNIRPLESSGYVRVAAGEDRRSREVQLTDEGRRVLEMAKDKWQKAQEIFESEVGEKESDVLRQMLSDVASIDFLTA